jgi:hypothetical protein
VTDLAETIEPGSSAAVLVWENLSAAPSGAAVRHAGGQLAASGRIPIQAVLAAIEADAGEADWTHMIVLNLILIGLVITLEPIPLTISSASPITSIVTAAQVEGWSRGSR